MDHAVLAQVSSSTVDERLAGLQTYAQLARTQRCRVLGAGLLNRGRSPPRTRQFVLKDDAIAPALG